jgi:hypothetical protein
MNLQIVIQVIRDADLVEDFEKFLIRQVGQDF